MTSVVAVRDAIITVQKLREPKWRSAGPSGQKFPRSWAFFHTDSVRM